MTRRLLWVALLGVLVAIPVAAAAQPGITPAASFRTSLFFHLTGSDGDVPMNTLAPDPEFSASTRVSPAANSLCFAEGSDVSSLLDKEYHTVYGYHSPGPVEYQFLTGGRPTVHPERGIAADVRLLDDSPTLHWYLAVGPGEATGSAPLPLGNVVVRGTMRAGDEISVNDVAYREGEIILQGQSAPALLAGAATQGAEHAVVGGTHVYHFEVPLELESPVIPRATSFIFQVEVFIENPYCSGEGDYLMPSTVDMFTAEGFRPRLEIVVENPLIVECLHPQFVGEDLVVLASARSPWGAYDVARFNATLIQDGVRTSLPWRPVEHGTHHQEAPSISATLPNATRPSGSGPYGIELTVETVQGARATGVAMMSSEAVKADMPSVSVPFIMLALAGAALAFRNRR